MLRLNILHSNKLDEIRKTYNVRNHVFRGLFLVGYTFLHNVSVKYCSTFYSLPLHDVRSHGIKVRDALKAEQVAGKYY